MRDFKTSIKSAVRKGRENIGEYSIYAARDGDSFLRAHPRMTYNFLLCKRYLRRAEITPRRRFIAQVRSRANLSAGIRLRDFSFVS